MILSMLHSDRRKALQQRMAEYAATKRAADPMWGQGVLQLEVQNLTGDMSPRTAELVDLKAELAEQHRIQQGSESWQQNPHRTLTQYSAEEPEGTLDPEYGADGLTVLGIVDLETAPPSDREKVHTLFFRRFCFVLSPPLSP